MTKLLIIVLLALVGSAAAFSMTMSTDRRSFVRTAGTAGAAVAVTSAGSLINISSASAELADPTTEVDTSDFTTSESGLKYKVLKEGTGAIPAQGQTVKVSFDRRNGKRISCLLAIPILLYCMVLKKKLQRSGNGIEYDCDLLLDV
jgi:hypothetical protein